MIIFIINVVDMIVLIVMLIGDQLLEVFFLILLIKIVI